MGRDHGRLRVAAARQRTQASFNPAALGKAGIEFIDEDGGGPGVRLRKAKRKGVSRIKVKLKWRG